MNVIATYEFSDRDAAESAAQKVNDECGNWAARAGYGEVAISDDCNDMARAAQICLAYGGKPV